MVTKKNVLTDAPTPVRTSTAGAVQTQVHNTTGSGRKGRGNFMEGRMMPYFDLEDILFEYERQEAQIDLLQVLISDGAVDVVGAPENSVEYALYEICVRMQEINQELREFIRSRALPDVVENGREVYSATKGGATQRRYSQDIGQAKC